MQKWDSRGVPILTERTYPAGATQTKQKSAQKQPIGETKTITKCIARTSKKYVGRPADFHCRFHPHHHRFSFALSSLCRQFPKHLRTGHLQTIGSSAQDPGLDPQGSSKAGSKPRTKSLVKSLHSPFFKIQITSHGLTRCFFCKPNQLNSEEMDCCFFPNVKKTL